jgi:hypothetical protein
MDKIENIGKGIHQCLFQNVFSLVSEPNYECC